jgi:hypothetical protein
MATVWAWRAGHFNPNPSTGWSRTINFNNLSDLIKTLDAQGLRGSIEQLAIVAHGDFAGQVFLEEGPLSTTPDKLTILAPFLQHKGMMSFVSCIAGAGDGGSAFLKAVSRQLPTRVIVGYSQWGFVDTVPARNDPGNVQVSQAGQWPAKGAPRLTPWGAYAKWAYMGTIVRLPAEEQKTRPGKRCANPACPGHSSELSQGVAR